MKIVEKDPRVPFVLDPDRAETIDRQVGEVIAKMAENLDFEAKAETLGHTIEELLAKIDKAMIKSAKQPDELKRLTEDRIKAEAARRTPAQLANEKRDELKKLAWDVLRGFHAKQMAGRLAQWRTTCRLNGCAKQPRSGKSCAGGHKSNRRTHVFCPGHAGIKNKISKAEYGQLKNNVNLRVVAV